jgi:hypothetical protein
LTPAQHKINRQVIDAIPSLVTRLGAKVTRNLKIAPLCRRPTKTKKELD